MLKWQDNVKGKLNEQNSLRKGSLNAIAFTIKVDKGITSPVLETCYIEFCIAFDGTSLENLYKKL